VGKYRSLGTLFNRVFRNDLNANFTDVDTDILAAKAEALANVNAQKTRVDNLIIGTPQPSEIVDARGTYSVLRDRLNNVDSSLAENASSVTSKGAKTDGSNSLTAISSAISTSKEVIIPNGEFTITNELVIINPVNLTGKKGSKITNTNTTSSGDLKINSDDVSLENIELNGMSTVQGLYTGGAYKRLKIKKSKLTSAKHGIHINTANVEDVEISNNEITATGFGILTNNNAKNCKNLNISFNKIYSSQSDAIELNNPTTATGLTSDSFKQVKVIGNTLTADEFGSGTTAGFAVGIANTRDVVVLGNIADKSRREGLHIEDDQENIIAVANVFNGNLADGCRILPMAGAKPPTVSNNHFIKKDLTKTDSGIWRVFDVNGSLEVNLPNNYIRGFDTGLWLDGKGYANINGCTIEDCNIGVKTGDNAIINGTVFTINTPTLVQGKSGAIIDKVISKTVPTTILQYIGTAGQEGATLKGFNAKTTYTSTAGVANTINLFPLPSLMTGKIKIVRNGADKIFYVADVSWDGTTLTVTNPLKKNAGVIGSTFSLLNNAGKLALSVSNIANVQTFDLYYDFDGVYYQE
jgi:hypothetical protein